MTFTGYIGDIRQTRRKAGQAKRLRLRELSLESIDVIALCALRA